MPNKEGGYGGYRQPDRRNTERKVRAPGTQGGVRRGVTPPPYQPPYTPRINGNGVRPARYDPDALEEDWVRPEDVAPRRPAPSAPPPRRPAPDQGRRQRQLRRARRRLLLLGTVVGILVVSGIVTLLLPDSVTTPPGETATAETATLATRLVAPLPYGGGEEGTAVQAVDWGTVGPARQQDAHTYTAVPAQTPVVPECGRVTTEWFADAAFLGDSLTVGYSDYGINLGGALVLGYEGAFPSNFVNRTVLKNVNGEDEIPLDILAEKQPKKVYLMVGTNAMVTDSNDEGFLNYYGRLLDDLKNLLPDSEIYVQSILPVRTEALENAPGLAPEHLSGINASLQSLCAEKGCYYLDVASAFTDESGQLLEEYAQPDGIHLTVSGYTEWVSYLCTHVPYSKDNPYQPGSTYYLDDSLKQLISDIP